MSLPRLQAEETTCSKQRRAERAHLNHASMEMHDYSAVTEAMGAFACWFRASHAAHRDCPAQEKV